MPTYEFTCYACGSEFEEVRPIANRKDPAQCKCGAIAVREIKTPAYGIPDITPYIAVTGDRMGRPITSRVEHKAFLKRNKLVEVGNEPVRDTKRMRPIQQTAAYRAERRNDIKRALRAKFSRETLQRTR